MSIDPETETVDERADERAVPEASGADAATGVETESESESERVSESETGTQTEPTPEASRDGAPERGADEASEPDRTSDPDEETSERDRANRIALSAADAIPTNRWNVGLTVALVCVAVGVVAGNAAVFLSSVVGLGYVAYGYATRPPEPELAIERTVDPESPVPGDDVSVVLSIANEGLESISDLRIVDRPPADLEREGPVRAAVTLRPGETTTLEYALQARRGTYEFGDVTLVVRNASGAAEVRERVDLDDRIECDDALERMPLAGQTIQHTGRVETNVGGEGLEFYSTRAYHPTDPMNRVDWKRLARDGELTTIEFREERAASVVVVVDVREENAVVRDHRDLDGIALAKHAAGWTVTAMLGENNRVGVALYGGRGDYLLPRTGRDQAARARQVLEGEWRGSFGRPGWLSQGNGHVNRFCKHLADDKQIVFVTPVLDREPIASAHRFRAYGHEVTVVCPTLAPPETTGGRIERIDHRHRLAELRERGVRVVEWAPDESLHVAVERAKRRWSR